MVEQIAKKVFDGGRVNTASVGPNSSPLERSASSGLSLSISILVCSVS